jgi:hypothetical protein
MRSLSRITLFCISLLCIPALAQNETVEPPRDKAKPAMAALVGHVIYSCRMQPEDSFMAKTNPSYSDGSDSTGTPIPDNKIQHYFHSGDRLTTLAAETDMVKRGGFDAAHSIVRVWLRVRNETSHVTAWVFTEFYSQEVKPATIFRNLLDNLWFSAKPTTDIYPRVGMLKTDVLCRMGLPDRTNTDELSGDQLVYYGGKMYVYVSSRTGRVRNIQTSF